MAVDCGAWMPETLDGVLFGSYSTRKDGPICMAEMAQNGTLYVSSVENMMLETQYKLLEMVHGRFRRNGSANPVPANVRLIASTERNLLEWVERGSSAGTCTTP